MKTKDCMKCKENCKKNWTKQQQIIESIEVAYKFLDPTAGDMDGALQAYIEAHIGPQPEEEVWHDWSDDLWEACEMLKEKLAEMKDEQLELLVTDEGLKDQIRNCFILHRPETEYEIKTIDLLAHELHVAILRGSASANTLAKMYASGLE
ncbi:MAG: hypothetical protein ACE14P_06300 [Methanotrichaceae archaeon]